MGTSGALGKKMKPFPLVRTSALHCMQQSVACTCSSRGSRFHAGAAQAGISLLFCSMEVVSAGILIASRQITYLVMAMCATLATMAGFSATARAHAWGLQGVWWGALASLPLLFLRCERQPQHGACLSKGMPLVEKQQYGRMRRAGGILCTAFDTEHGARSGVRVLAASSC